MPLSFKQIIALSITIGIIAGVVSFYMMLPSTATLTEPLDESMEYDIFAFTLEDKFSVMESIALEGSGGLGDTQIFLDKETFLKHSSDKNIYYAESISKDSGQYWFTQTYWSKSEDDFLLIYERNYVPPKYHKIEKGKHELIYHYYDPMGSVPTFIGFFFGAVCFYILFFLWEKH